MARMTETLVWRPVATGLPDAETNVLLGLRDRTSCEGFYDGHDDDGTPIFRDVCADRLDRDVVIYWADLPSGPPECPKSEDGQHSHTWQNGEECAFCNAPGLAESRTLGNEPSTKGRPLTEEERADCGLLSELDDGSGALGVADPTILAPHPDMPEQWGQERAQREQTLAGLVKRLAQRLHPEDNLRVTATEYLKEQGFFNPLRTGGVDSVDGGQSNG